jgi:hypothetical protein
MKQMPFILLVLGVAALLGLNHEYQAIKARLAITQAKVDTLADETNATVEILGAAIQDLREVFARFKAGQSRSTQQDTQQDTQQVTQQVKPTIVMHSGASCGPCNLWKSKEQSKWERVGWTVEVLTEIESTRLWPWFEVYDTDGSRFEVNGPLTKDSFEKAKQSK